MKTFSLLLLIIVPQLAYGGPSLASGISPAQGEEDLQASGKCEDEIDDCEAPIKFLGAVEECSCFSCATGTDHETRVCTKDETDITILWAQIEEEWKPPVVR